MNNKQIKELTTNDTFNGMNIENVSSKDNGNGTTTYDVTLQGKLTTIKKNSFSETESAINIALPDSILSMSTDTFENCSNLESVNLTNVDTKVIEQTSLTTNPQINVVLPDGTKLRKHYVKKDTDITYDYLMKIYFYDTDNEKDIIYSVYSYGSQFYNAIISGQVNTWYSLSAEAEEDHERTADYPNWYIKTTTKATRMNPNPNEIWYKTSDEKKLEFNDTFIISYDDGTSTTFTVNKDCIKSNEYNEYGVITLKEGYTHEQLKEQLENLFIGQETLTEVYIGEGITCLPKYMFRECTNLNILFMPDTVTELGIGTFYACTNLIILRMSDKIEVLPEYCFFCCVNLYMFNLPNQLETINSYAFGECKLGKTYALYYPNPSKEYPFGYGTTVYTEENKTGVLFTNTNDKDTYANVIRDWTVYAVNSLGGLTLPASLTTIKDNAFYDTVFEGIILLDKNMEVLPECDSDAFYKASKIFGWMMYRGDLVDSDDDDDEYGCIKTIDYEDDKLSETDKKYIDAVIKLFGFTFVGPEKLLDSFTKKQVVQGNTTSDEYLIYSFDDGWKFFNGSGVIDKNDNVFYLNCFTTYDDVTIQGGYSLNGCNECDENGDYNFKD